MVDWQPGQLDPSGRPHGRGRSEQCEHLKRGLRMAGPAPLSPSHRRGPLPIASWPTGKQPTVRSPRRRDASGQGGQRPGEAFSRVLNSRVALCTLCMLTYAYGYV